MKGMMQTSITVILMLVMCVSVFALDSARYIVDINQSGTYYVWLRVKAAYDGESIVNVKIDDSGVSSVSFTDNQSLVWKKVATPFSLAVGSHEIRLQTNALGTYVDKFILTTDVSYIPTGSGAASQRPASMVNLSQVINLGGKGGRPIIGDLNKDGKPDYVIGGTEYISAFDNSGTLMWQRPISGRISSLVGEHGVHCRPIDIDMDGDVEVVGVMFISDTLYLAALNGVTGVEEALLKFPTMADGWYVDGTQIGNLRGLSSPTDIVIKTADAFGPFRVYVYSFVDSNFQFLWEFHSEPGETRAGCQQPKVYDIDGDGYDEVLYGHWTLEEDGQIKWEKPDGFFDDNNHVDSMKPGDIIPSHPGIEIAYSSGNVLLDPDGNVIWRKDEYRDFDGQSVAIAEIRPDLPGLEVLFAYQEPRNDERLFSSDGTLIWTFDGNSAYAASFETYPIQWIGDEGKESVREEWGRDRSPSIYDEYNNLVVRLRPEDTYGEIGYRPCDVTGDYREELVCFNENYILIYENVAPNSRSFPSPWSDPAYAESHYNWVYY